MLQLLGSLKYLPEISGSLARIADSLEKIAHPKASIPISHRPPEPDDQDLGVSYLDDTEEVQKDLQAAQDALKPTKVDQP